MRTRVPTRELAGLLALLLLASGLLPPMGSRQPGAAPPSPEAVLEPPVDAPSGGAEAAGGGHPAGYPALEPPTELPADDPRPQEPAQPAPPPAEGAPGSGEPAPAPGEPAPPAADAPPPAADPGPAETPQSGSAKPLRPVETLGAAQVEQAQEEQPPPEPAPPTGPEELAPPEPPLPQEEPSQPPQERDRGERRPSPEELEGREEPEGLLVPDDRQVPRLEPLPGVRSKAHVTLRPVRVSAPAPGLARTGYDALAALGLGAALLLMGLILRRLAWSPGVPRPA